MAVGWQGFLQRLFCLKPCNAQTNIATDKKEPSWTFVPTMSYIIKHEAAGLALLGLMWQTRHFKTPIPSWVADFTVSADWNDEHNPVFLRGSCANAAWSWKQDTIVSSDQTTLSASGLSFGKVTNVISFVDGDRKYYVERFREIQTLVNERCPQGHEPLWRTLVGIRNTDPEVCEPMPESWEMLMGRAEERGGEAQRMFQDALLPIVRKRKFFVTDNGFAGVATPMVLERDTVVIIPGMVRAAVLREADPNELGIHIGQDVMKDVSVFHRITGFAYVGCHSRGEFERLEKAGPENWKAHVCLRREMEKFHII